jgi:hypothetical protein
MSALAVLMVTVGIGMLIYICMHITIGIPVAISRVQTRSFFNYAGFPVDRKEMDAQMISFGEITMTNISTNEKIALDLKLHVTAKNGVHIESSADLAGPLGMILGKDDSAAKQFATSAFGEASKYFRNTIELGPGQIERRRLSFLFDFGSEFREKVATLSLIWK